MRAPRVLTTAVVTTAFGLLGVAAAAPASAATTTALWNMGDTGSTMSDASGHGHTGTLHGVTTGVPGTTSTGKAFGFTKKPAYVTVPSATDLNPGTGTFSVTLSVKYAARPSSSVGDYDLLRKGLGTTSGGDYKVEVLGNGKAFCHVRGSAGTVDVTSSTTPSLGSWHRITCKRTSSGVTLTVDGSSTTKSGATGTLSNTSTLYIGARDSSGGDQLTGSMDAVSISKG